MAQSQPSFISSEFAVWGPTGSGKDWLFKSFVRELEYYNRKQSGGFQYSLSSKEQQDEDFVRDYPEAPENKPSSIREDIWYQFERIPITQDDAHRISAHVHRIVLHNNKGADLLDSVKTPDLFEQAFQALRISQNILITMDPTSATSSKVKKAGAKLAERALELDQDYDGSLLPPALQPTNSEAASRPINKSEYYEFLSRLLDRLSTSTPGTGGKYRLAVCLTKYDSLRLAGTNWNILESVFGRDIRTLLEGYRSHFHIEAFLTSAAGFIETPDRGKIPNINIKDGNILDFNRWEPWNVSAPFFWVFENNERDRISDTSARLYREHNLRNYLPYPKRVNG